LSKVIKAENFVQNPKRTFVFKEFGEKEQEEILQNAEKEAEEIINDAREKRLAVFEEARKSGRDSGYKDGYEQGYSDGKLKAAGIIERAEKTLAEAVEERKKIISSVEEEMVELIIKISSKVINREVKIDRGIIIGLVKQGLNEVNLSGDIKIHVSKRDYEIVSENSKEISAKVKNGANIEFVKDLSLNRCDCIIETEYGSIECGLDSQFGELKKNLQFLCNNTQ